MSSTEAAADRIVPAHLDFLAIYNPSLGLSEETEKDQIVFYWSKIAHGATGQTHKDDDAARVARDTANEQLRQIGLAQGIVHFARGFAKGEAVDSIDTEKHRIVLQQIETGWWILASINLTILPNSRRNHEAIEGPRVEYSAREVSPPALLLAQLTAAHRIFELHHGPSLSELYGRVKKLKFCKLLDIYWTAFARDWDVLLHGNPAADIYNGIKLAAGGELGMGVGEEEWGSGERDALEGIVSNTDGLVDLVVSRFGHAVTSDPLEQSNETPWLGSLRKPDAVDGIVFTGVGSLSRTSLRLISSWMASIYTYGEDAYGVLDNPSSGRRTRRPQTIQRSSSQKEPIQDMHGSGHLGVQRGNTDDTITERSYAAALRHETELSTAHIDDQNNKNIHAVEDTAKEVRSEKSQDEAAARRDPTEVSANQPKPTLNNSYSSEWARSNGPSIPPPIVSAAEDALKHATEQAEEAARKREEAEKSSSSADASTSTLKGDKWSKYLTLGYGSSWHIPGLQRDMINSKASDEEPKKTVSATSNDNVQVSTSTDTRRIEAPSNFAPPKIPISDSVGDDPSPHGGRYLIGLKGDLDNNNDGSGPENEESELQDNGGDRIVIRTIHAGVNVPDKPESMKSSGASSRSRAFYDENGSVMSTVEMKRLRVVVYVNQPFIFTFLFDLSSAFDALSTPSFFRTLHANLAPLHKPLLASTSPSNVASRLTSFLTVPLPYQNGVQDSSPIYDLVHDPYNLTVHTSIPNIPLPGTPAAEGFLPYSPAHAGATGKMAVAPWTRVEALNVHSQILNAYAETRRQDGDREHQAKTSRGWWVVWMRLTATATYDSASQGHGGSTDGEGFREAVLIRRASDRALAIRADGSPRKTSGYGFGRLIGREDPGSTLSEGGNASETEGGNGSSWGPGRVTEGIGVDVRKYVESLLSLSR